MNLNELKRTCLNYNHIYLNYYYICFLVNVYYGILYIVMTIHNIPIFFVIRFEYYLALSLIMTSITCTMMLQSYIEPSEAWTLS